MLGNNTETKPAIRLGAALEIPLSSHFFLTGGATYNQAKIASTAGESRYGRGEDANIQFHYLNIPVGFGYRIGDPRDMAVSFEIGGTASFRLSEVPIPIFYGRRLQNALPSPGFGLNLSTSIEISNILFRAGADGVIRYGSYYLTLGYRF